MLNITLSLHYALQIYVKEPTKSTILLLIDKLKNKQANLWINDPLFTDKEISEFGVTPLSLKNKLVSEIDVVILQAFHQEYSMINFNKFMNCKLILDGRNKLNKEEISRLGIQYISIGN